MNDIAVKIIMDYINERPYTLSIDTPNEYFDQVTYSRWSSYEVLRMIMDNPLTPPITLLEGFITKMDYFSCLREETSRIFSIAKDTAEDILYLFL